jgi:hypothetical protein
MRDMGSESSTARQGGHSWLVTAFVVMVAIAVLLAAALWLLGYLCFYHEDHLTLLELSQKTRVRFPPGSNLLRVTGASLTHVLCWAQIEMPAREVEPFLRSLAPKGQAVWISRKVRLEPQSTLPPWRMRRGSFKWWRPDSARRFVSARTQVGGSGGTETCVTVDLDDPNRPIVYFSFFRD